MSAGVSHTHWTAKLKKKKKKELKSANPPNQILTHSLTHNSTLKKKKKDDAEGGRTYKHIPFFITISISIFIIHSVR